MPARRCIDCRVRYTPGNPSRCPSCATAHTARRDRAHAARRAAAPGNGARRRLRQAVNLAGHGRCAVCGTWRLAADIEIDHIRRLGDGGTDTDDNVRPLCTDCHAIKTRSEAQAAYS